MARTSLITHLTSFFIERTLVFRRSPWTPFSTVSSYCMIASPLEPRAGRLASTSQRTQKLRIRAVPIRRDLLHNPCTIFALLPFPSLPPNYGSTLCPQTPICNSESVPPPLSSLFSLLQLEELRG
jgi:hypothetical protein